MRRPLLSLFCLLAAPSLAGAQYGPGVGSPYRGPVDSRGHYARQMSGTTIEEWARRLESKDPRERLEAVQNFGQSEDARAVTYLLKAVEDTDARVSVRAVDFLGDRRAADAAPLLAQKLFVAGAPPLLHQHVLAALGKIGDTRSSRPILDFIQQDNDAASRGTAMYTLGEIGDISARDDLQKLRDAERDPRVRQIAEEALAKLGESGRPKSDTFVPPSNALVPPVR